MVLTDVAPHSAQVNSGAARVVRFERELDMHAPIAKIARQLSLGLPGERSNPAHVLFEVPAAAGVPDVLRVAFNRARLQDRIEHSLDPVIDLTELRTLVAASRGPATLSRVSVAAGVTSQHLRRTIVPKLVESGWLEPLTGRGDRATITPRTTYRPLARSVVTVEAKRRDWRSAISQARRHQACADRAYIAIDGASAGPLVDFADELSRTGLGLVTVDAASDRATLVTRPQPGRPRIAEHALVAERAWSLVLAGRTTWDTYNVFGRDLTASRA